MIVLTLDSETLCKQNSSNKPENFTVYFSNPLNFTDGKYEVSLYSGNIWYSWYNINKENNNNYFWYGNANNKSFFELNDGMYDIDRINQLVTDINGDERITFKVDKYSSKCIIKIDDDHFIDFTDGELYKILGFEQKRYKGGTHLSPNLINITNGLDRVFIKCSIVDNSYFNGKKDKILFSFTPNDLPSSLLRIHPKPDLMWLNIGEKTVQELQIRIVNKDDKDINLNGEHITLVLLITKIY